MPVVDKSTNMIGNSFYDFKNPNWIGDIFAKPGLFSALD